MSVSITSANWMETANETSASTFNNYFDVFFMHCLIFFRTIPKVVIVPNIIITLPLI